MMKPFLGFFFLVLMLLMSCSKDENPNTLTAPAGCDTLTLIYSYSNDIKPIIGTNCAGSTCHIEGTGNYDFTTYEVLADRIRSGKFEYRLLLPVTDAQHMPQAGTPSYKGISLNPCDLYKILSWIKQGYRNN